MTESPSDITCSLADLLRSDLNQIRGLIFDRAVPEGSALDFSLKRIRCQAEDSDNGLTGFQSSM